MKLERQSAETQSNSQNLSQTVAAQVKVLTEQELRSIAGTGSGNGVELEPGLSRNHNEIMVNVEELPLVVNAIDSSISFLHKLSNKDLV